MNKINFQNKEFKVRSVFLPKFGDVLISTNTLNNLLLNQNGGYSSIEAELIDEKLFFFVDDNEIDLNDKDLLSLLNLELK